jgi:hypothetical protein
MPRFGLPSLLKGKDLPKYTEKEVRAYNDLELEKMFDHATQDESDLLRFLLRRLLVDVLKKSSTVRSFQEGEFDTSTITWDTLSTSASPSPVSVLTPVFGEAATA